MPYNPQIHHRKSIRLKGYDYSKSGSYFVTICAKDRICYFGRMKGDNSMDLSEIGNVAKQCWLEIPKHFPAAASDQFIIMPNHIHGIVRIDAENVGAENVGAENVGAENVGAENFQPLHGNVNNFQHMIPRSLGSIIKGFKIGVTKWCRNNNKDFLWQRNFYDHIIRNDNSYENICNYIQNNPSNWHKDIENKQFCKVITEKQREEYYKRLIITKK